MMMNHADKVDAILGKGTAAAVAEPIIMREEIFKYFPQDTKATPDWAKMNRAFQKNIPPRHRRSLQKQK